MDKEKIANFVEKTSEYILDNADAVRQAFNEFRLDKNFRLKTTASSMAFYSLWSLIPMIYLIIEIVLIFNPDILNYLRDIIFSISGETGINVFNTFVSNRVVDKPSVLIFFIASLIVSTTKLSRTIVLNTELVFAKRNSIFGLKISFVVRWILSYIISTVFPLILALVLIFSNLASSFIHYFDKINPFNEIFINIINYSIVPISIFIFILLIFMITNPASKNIKYNYQASLFVALFWFITSKIMSLFVVKNLELAIYGSFSLMILLLIWIYIFCYIFSIGIIINKYVYNFIVNKYGDKIREVYNEI